ncbi:MULTISPECIES: ABC transporter substrate-binding protein [unclassified Fusibacter]|uniref:ABC transporter substrate-binding protein n=1 Tax=unclassified Fusibacter TaxID=2624464 RepID=UPI001013BB46|nr:MULTISPECIES: ABC transporter substrate-binding protein [unclassified Fusibacter]NPE22181.1 amino acid ABC transporter substrate-binding protein [Fusibacter sp. A1]RXV60957.1 amino acid ABC transporter substrate-binding protein [Fusibacter sp. A1]
MKSILNYMIFILCIALILIGCFPSRNIKIGFAGSLTGKSYELGIPAKNGFILAVEHINTQGGINGAKLIPVIKDDESTVETAYVVAQEFIEEDVTFVIGFLTSNMAPVIQEPLSNEQLFL